MPVESRTWQLEAVDRNIVSRSTSWLCEATPGAGKTRFALMVCKKRLDAGEVDRVIVVVPTDNLKTQWADVDSGVNLQPFNNNDCVFPRDMDGIVVSYQQVASVSELFRKHTAESKTLVVLDEIHHCGATKAWGSAIWTAFRPASYTLALSGTPFRSDNEEIPFVRYVDGCGVPDFRYGYDDALRDGICRAVMFPRRGGVVDWVSSHGELRSEALGQTTNGKDSSEALRAALLAGEWLPSVMVEANDMLEQKRLDDPQAGGLVLCMDMAHARKVADTFARRLGIRPALAVSEDPNSSKVIRAFRTSQQPWLVAVRLVSEGIDIPRLRVLVYATNYTTEMFFRQAVGRVIRMRADLVTDDGQEAYVYIPDDQTLREYAERIKRQVDHFIEEESPTGGEPRDPGDGRQPSLFTPITSTEADNRGAVFDGRWITADEIRAAEALQSATNDQNIKRLPVQSMVEVIRMVGGQVRNEPKQHENQPAHEKKAAVRTRVHQLVKTIGKRHQLEYDAVHIALNNAVGIRKTAEATAFDLSRKEALAIAWLNTGIPPCQ